MNNKKYTNTKNIILKVISAITVLLITIIFMAPFYVAFCYSFKSRQEIAVTALSLPKNLKLDNFIRAIEKTNISGMPFSTVMENTIIVTIVGTFLLTLLSIMCAYSIARRKSMFYSIVYSLMVFSLLVPLQTYMFPLYTLLRKFNLLNTLSGFILAKIGAQIGYSVIITTGFVKSIPAELEAAAFIDGCEPATAFFKVILPLLRPIMLTSIILNVLSIWNDFSTAFIILSTPKKYIVPLLQFSFMGTNSNEMQLAFAMFVMTMIPVLVLYFIFQKYIISGITAGSVKG